MRLGLGLSIGISHPLMQGVPAWVSGADLAWDFAQNRKWRGALDPADTHAATIYAPNAAGVYSPFTANVLTRTDLGLQTVPTRTNLFLNSFVPATQTVTVANATQYTVSSTGLGSVALSGAGTGTVTDGSPVTFTSGSTSLVCTVSGAPATCNVTTDAFAVPPILTTGTAATVNGNQQIIDLTGKLASGVAGFIQFDSKSNGGGTTPRVFEFHTGIEDHYFMAYMNGADNYVVQNDIGGSASSNAAGQTNGLQTMAFAAGPNFLAFRVVGQSAPTVDTSVTWGADMSRLVIMGRGSDAACNNYALTKKLALKFGAQDQASFDGMYAKAVLAAAA